MNENQPPAVCPFCKSEEDFRLYGITYKCGTVNAAALEQSDRCQIAALTESLRVAEEKSNRQSAEIARLERENATCHADATEAVKLMIEAQKKRDEFRRSANEANRELADLRRKVTDKENSLRHAAEEVERLRELRDAGDVLCERLEGEIARPDIAGFIAEGHRRAIGQFKDKCQK